MKFKTSKLEILFIFALFCEILAMQIGLTTLPFTYSNTAFYTKLLRYSGYMLVSIKIFFTKFRYSEILLLICITFLVGVNIPSSGRFFFLTFLFVYGMKGMNFEKISKIMCIWILSGIFFTILLSQFGIIENWSYDLATERSRYSLGYYYPSHATSVILYGILLLCYVLKQHLKLCHVVLLEFLNYLQYTKTDSRTGTALAAIAILCFYCLKFIKKEKTKISFGILLSYAFIFSAIISISSTILYDPDVETWSQINSFVNGRVRLANSAVNTYGVSLLGKQITWIGNGGLGHIYDNLKETYNYVDCSYIKLLLEGGVLSFLLIIIGYTLAGRKAAKEGNIYLCMALAFIAIYSIIEPRLCEIGFNPFLLVLVILVDYRGIFLMNHQKKETMFRKKIQLCNVKNP